LRRSGHYSRSRRLPDDTARAVAGHVAGLIHDGDCIQTGIGAIPAAILAALVDKTILACIPD
jgi:acyl-CoA hydrolase